MAPLIIYQYHEDTLQRQLQHMNSDRAWAQKIRRQNQFEDDDRRMLKSAISPIPFSLFFFQKAVIGLLLHNVRAV